uniref:Coiled-coil domain-containing protein 28B n=1 Tax=Phlebotomus kandelakii TaxID=1109342 RepID=A0A6B2E4N1_9DIPT
MECNEAVERQKLVSNDTETDDVPSSAPKSSIQTPISPVLSSKVFSSGDTSRSQNSTTCSVGKGHTDAQQQSTKLTFVNERKLEAIAKAKAKKIHRDLPSPKTVQAPTHPVHSSNFSFADRPLKHHSFISDDGSVRNMERALLGLLEDFHSGKLRAFGSGCTMEQMTDIREQQERLAKLHFELGGEAAEDSQAELNAQQKMSQLVMKLENLSVSIEKLHSSNSDL